MKRDLALIGILLMGLIMCAAEMIRLERMVEDQRRELMICIQPQTLNRCIFEKNRIITLKLRQR
jgi:hypothetical protein